jgi:hypothetical protein
MPIKFFAILGCFLVRTGSERVDLLRSSAVPEFKVLFLLGGGLVALASLVRWLHPMNGEAAPKSMEVRMWISPAEVAEKFVRLENR